MIDSILRLMSANSRRGFLVSVVLISLIETGIAILMAELAAHLILPDIASMVGWRLPVMVAIVAMSIIVPATIMEMRVGSSLREANMRLHKASHTDFLTNVSNRAGFVSAASRQLHEADSHSALLLLDADYFKSINDRYGHDVGDKVLVAIANTMKFCVRRHDLIGRLGGEEFAVYLAAINAQQTEIIAERIRSSIAKLEIPVEGHSEMLTLTVSLGAIHIDMPAAFDACFRVADNALYKAKAEGRNLVRMSKLSDVSLLEEVETEAPSGMREALRLYG